MKRAASTAAGVGPTPRASNRAKGAPSVRRAGIAAEAGGGADARAPKGVVRLLCVDDHALLIEGLKAQFAIERRIEIVGWLPSAARLIEEVERLRPDAVLLDIEMPGPDVFETADRLRRLHPEVHLIALTAHIRDSYIRASYAAGLCAYFAKSEDPSALADRVVEAAGSGPGAFLVGPKVRERCAPLGTPGWPRSARRSKATAEGEPRTLLASLSGREAEVLRLIGRGLSRNQIAGQLCRSAKTIDGHQVRILKKLRLATRAELMRLAIREGLA